MKRLLARSARQSAAVAAALLLVGGTPPALATGDLSPWHMEGKRAAPRAGASAAIKRAPRVTVVVAKPPVAKPDAAVAAPATAIAAAPESAAVPAPAPLATIAPPPRLMPSPVPPVEQKLARITPPERPAPPSLSPPPTPRPGLPTSDVRPPQYVLLAFDGSQSAEMWRQTTALADELTRSGRPAKFTYFISGVYFLSEKTRKLYDAPVFGAGRSYIGFGSTKNNDIAERIAMVNAAHASGHEIASHANGHFDGKSWSEAHWQSEFRQFNALLFDAARNNDLPIDEMTGKAPQLTLPQRSIVGFRAPMLGHSPGLWHAMAAHGFRYDTSRTNKPDYWPKKLPLSGWNFPLGEIKVPGTAMRTLSMDYNFYVVQSGAKPNPAQAQRYEEQMFQAYLNYFNTNYLGNRAPVHIGHHFAQWNGGAYWRAFQRFARIVCGKPEVKCVTYRDMADDLDKTTPETIASWQRGAFPRLEGASGVQITLGRPLEFTLAFAGPTTDGVLRLATSGPDWQPRAYNVAFEIDGVAQPPDVTPTLASLRATLGTVPSGTFGWRVYKGADEIAWLTHRITLPGTAREQISARSLEAAALEGEPASAHHHDCDHPHTF